MKKTFVVTEAVYIPRENFEVEEIEENVVEEETENEDVAEEPSSEINGVKTEDVTEEVVEEVVEDYEEYGDDDYNLSIVVNEKKLTEDCDSLRVRINREEFRTVFGSKSKPRKGDVLAIYGFSQHFEVKKSEKYSDKKNGKGYKLSLRSIEL